MAFGFQLQFDRLRLDAQVSLSPRARKRAKISVVRSGRAFGAAEHHPRWRLLLLGSLQPSATNRGQTLRGKTKAPTARSRQPGQLQALWPQAISWRFRKGLVSASIHRAESCAPHRARQCATYVPERRAV